MIAGMSEGRPIPIWLRAVFGVLALVDIGWMIQAIPEMQPGDDWDFEVRAGALAIGGNWMASGRVRMR